MFSDQMCLQPHWESALRSAHPKLSGTRAVLIKLSISGGSEGNTTHRAVQFLMVLKFFLFFFFNRKPVIILGKLLSSPALRLLPGITLI